MKLLHSGDKITDSQDGCVATIGNFDGVHCGHQALLNRLRQQADKMNLPMVVILFEPQPGEYFSREKAPVRLYRLREKINALQQCGVDYVYCLKFNEQLANMSPEAFIETIILSSVNAKYLLLGDDFKFGRNRSGDLTLLREFGLKHGFIVETYPDHCIDKKRVSSTQIRQALQLGQLQQAAELLGRPYSLTGRVVYGQGLGRQLGFPTANISVHRRTLPINGVFCVQVKRQSALVSGVANIGTRPTINGRQLVLEVHLFDFNESLYGERLEVFFLRKLRDEMKFSSLDALSMQIHADITAAREYV